MQRKNSLMTGVSLLIVAVLVITAFTRNTLQLWLLIGAFTVWGIWATIRFLVPYLQRVKLRYDARKLMKRYEEQAKQKARSTSTGKSNPSTDMDDPTGLVLLRHVNYRVTAYLQALYPDATWEWQETYPERIIANSGTARIRIFNAADYNYADVTFDRNAKIECNMLKIVPMVELTAEGGNTTALPQKEEPVNPQVWYEKQARTVLQSLIHDLNSRGHHRLTIRDTGEIAIQQADQEITRPAFESVPERVHWPRLKAVFEREGMAADITDNGMVLSW